MSRVIAAAYSTFQVEPASWRDLGALRSLEKVCFPKDSWPLWDLIGVLTLPNLIRLRAVVEGEMVGFIAADIRAQEKTAWIATLGVLPEQRGRGIGTQLLRECEQQIRLPWVRLCVRLSNEEAIRLYQREGYHRDGLWQRYYIDGEDALVMEKKL